MFVGADEFLWIAENYRTVWIAGRRGGHKTSVAYWLARHWLDRGYSLFTNGRCVYADDLPDFRIHGDGMAHAVVVLDEGGLYFRTRGQVEEITAYLRHMDIIVLIPSFAAPHSVAHEVTLQPVWSMSAAGLPIICYQWRVRQTMFTSEGRFYWVMPGESYGVYSSQFPGDDPGDIVTRLTELVSQHRRHYNAKGSSGRRFQIPTLEGLISEVVDERLAQDAPPPPEHAAPTLLKRGAKR